MDTTAETRDLQREPNAALLKRLLLRVDGDDPIYPGSKKLKIRGKDLNDLPLEIFWISDLEVNDTLEFENWISRQLN